MHILCVYKYEFDAVYMYVSNLNQQKNQTWQNV